MGFFASVFWALADHFLQEKYGICVVPEPTLMTLTAAQRQSDMRQYPIMASLISSGEIRAVFTPNDSVVFSLTNRVVETTGTVSVCGSLYLWETNAANHPLNLLETNSAARLWGSRSSDMTAFALDTARNLLFTPYGNVWNLNQHQVVAHLTIPDDNAAFEIQVDTQRERVVVQADNNFGMLWEYRGAHFVETRNHDLSGTYWSINGLIANSVAGGRIALFDPENESQIYLEAPGVDYFLEMSFSPDRQYLEAVGSDQNTYLWNIVTGRLLLVSDVSGSNFFFSPDSRYVLALMSDHLTLWDLRHLDSPVIISQSTSDFSTMAFHPSGHTIAVGSDDGIVNLWNVDGVFVGQVDSADGWVRQLQFNTSGTKLLINRLSEHHNSVRDRSSVLTELQSTSYESHITIVDGAFNAE